MPSEQSWSDVRGGVIAFVALLVAALGIMWFLRVGRLHGDTFTVYALVSDASALAPGSEVWLSGQKIGKVTHIDFRPATTDTSTRLLVQLQLLSEHQDAIHRDASAEIRAGGSFIGAVVVYLTPGTTKAPRLAEGDTLLAKPLTGVESAAEQVTRLMKEVPAIRDTLGQAITQLKSPSGTTGAFMAGGLKGMSELSSRSGRLMGRLQGGGGTAGLVMQGGLGTRASRVMARADSVRALLASPRTSYGRFRKDSTLQREVADIQGELARLQQALDEPRGTAGRVMRDSALTNALASAMQEMSLLFADLKAHPGRYISF